MKSWERLAVLTIAVCASTVLIGCGGAGAGGADPGGDNDGGAFTLPAGTIGNHSGETQARFVVPGSPDPDPPLVSYGPVDISGGSFPGLALDPPPTAALSEWSEVETVAETLLNDFYSDNGLDIQLAPSDVDAQFLLITGLNLKTGSGPWSAEPQLFRQRADGNVEPVFWLYVDRDVTVSGSDSVSTTIPGFGTATTTLQINADLESGWNTVSGRTTGTALNPTFIYEAGSDPSDASWRAN